MVKLKYKSLVTKETIDYYLSIIKDEDEKVGLGFYQVLDSPQPTVNTDKAALGGNITGPIASFTGDCQQNQPIAATGTIAAGESQTCNIFNNFVIEEDDATSTVASSPIIAQGKQYSSELTALEKVEKLKKQWLELLP